MLTDKRLSIPSEVNEDHLAPSRFLLGSAPPRQTVNFRMPAFDPKRTLRGSRGRSTCVCYGLKAVWSLGEALDKLNISCVLFLESGGCPVDVPCGNSASDNSIRAAERQRISRELHNSTSQLLVALQLQVGQLKSSVAPGTAEHLLDEIAETLQNIHETITEIGIPRRDGDESALEERQVQTSKLFYLLSRSHRACG